MQAIEPFPRHRLSVGDFHKMAEAGIFAPEDRIELIEGELVDMAPVGSAHASLIDYLTQALVAQTQKKNQAIVRVQSPVVLGDRSEPQPDIALLKPRKDFYRHAHPQARDILCLIEVADTSLVYDRDTKLPLYAKNGIVEVGLIVLGERRVEIYRLPHPGQRLYQDRQIHTRGQAALTGLDTVHIDVDALFKD